MMLLPIPIPVALVCPAYLIDDDADLKGVPLTSIHKETLAALKKAGYKRTRVEENDLTIIGSATEVDLLSPDGKEKISLKFNTEDDSTVDREILVPETKAAAYARYGSQLKAKFPNVVLVCYAVNGKTYAVARVELSEASPKNVMEALAETKRAIAFLEQTRDGVSAPKGDLSDVKALPLTDNQKAVFNALEKSGYRRVRVTAEPNEEQRYVTLDPPGSDFKVFVYVSPRRMRLQRSLDVADTENQATARARPIPEKFPGMTARVYDLLGRISTTLEFALSDSEATPTRALDAIAALGRGIAFLKDAPLPPPAPTDPVGKTLQASKLIYTDIGNFYKLKFDNSNTKRSQYAYVRKDVYSYNSLSVQEIYSLCYDSPDAPSAALLEKTFQKGFSLGGLVLEAPSETQKNWRIRFKIDAPTDLPLATLSTYLNLVQGTSDEIEKELNPDKGDLL